MEGIPNTQTATSHYLSLADLARNTISELKSPSRNLHFRVVSSCLLGYGGKLNLILNHHNSCVWGCCWACDHGTSYLKKPFEQAYWLKGSMNQRSLFMPLKFYYWIHKIPPFPSPKSKTFGSFLSPSLCPWACPCFAPWPFCPSVWPMCRRQMPICHEKSF